MDARAAVESDEEASITRAFSKSISAVIAIIALNFSHSAADLPRLDSYAIVTRSRISGSIPTPRSIGDRSQSREESRLSRPAVIAAAISAVAAGWQHFRSNPERRNNP
jgi:hypothetical protein